MPGCCQRLSTRTSVPGLMMGSLLAIPPSIAKESLQLETQPAKKLFEALQDYGAYVVDDTSWDAHYIAVENGVEEEFLRHYGYELTGTEGPFYRDFMKLCSALKVVNNNSATTIGGGGKVRVPPAPPL